MPSSSAAIALHAEIPLGRGRHAARGVQGLDPVTFSVRSIFHAEEPAIYERVPSQPFFTRTMQGVHGSWVDTLEAWKMARRSARATANPWSRFDRQRRFLSTTWRFITGFSWALVDAARFALIFAPIFGLLWFLIGP